MLRDQLRPLIPRIVSRELTNRDVARLLGASEYHVCRVLKQLGVVREPIPDTKSERALRRELEKTRATFRASVAKTMSIKDAAAAANCSTRTIYRFRSKNGTT